MKNIKIIYDISSPDLIENRVFDYDVARMVDVIPLYSLAIKLKDLGYQVMTADVFLEIGDFEGLNLMITETETKYTNLLISHNCIPAICYCGESPLVIPQYYSNLKINMGRFVHCYLFKGAHSRLSECKNIHTFYWTNLDNKINNDVPWEKKRYLTLINSNKHSSKPPRIKKIADIFSWLKIVMRYILNWKAFHTFPGNIPDLYNTRLEALLYFCKNKNFDLYGQGWNKRILGVTKNEQELIHNSFRGGFPRGNANKHDILKNYKFAICFENTEFSGYITEKIFDCILCGTIPIYLGAPDIVDFIPSDVFIDFKKYSTFAELENYLTNMTYEDSKRYRDAAYEFVSSLSYEKYHLIKWQTDILNSIESVIENRDLNIK